MFLSSRKMGPIVLMLVLVHFFAPAAYALPPSGSSTALRSKGLISTAWEWLVSLVPPGGAGLQSIWGKAGSSMDPNGCPQSSVGTLPEAGSSMDPNGDK